MPGPEHARHLDARPQVDELLGQCNPNAARSKQERAWLRNKPVGLTGSSDHKRRESRADRRICRAAGRVPEQRRWELSVLINPARSISPHAAAESRKPPRLSMRYWRGWPIFEYSIDSNGPPVKLRLYYGHEDCRVDAR